MLLAPPISMLFPYTTLFRSDGVAALGVAIHAVDGAGENPRVATSGCPIFSALEDDRCHAWSSHRDRKSTRLNSSHLVISYAVFCLKKKITPLLPHLRSIPSV